MSRMKEMISLLRPWQWMKNLFVLAPLFFSGNLLNYDMWPSEIIVFFSFCFISSSIYCFNDICDAELDRLHPQKCKRPIAKGIVSKNVGYFLMVACMCLSFIILFFLENGKLPYILFIVIIYWFLNMLYCLKLKQYAVIDVSIIAIGFVLRVLAGGLATGILVSQWLVLLTFLISIFLALGKRSNDYHYFEKTGEKPRVSITGYNIEFINGATTIVVSVTLVSYIMYTLSDEVIERIGTPYLYLTSVWVLIGLLRYLQKMIVYDSCESPTKVLLKDRFIQLCVCGWILSFIVLLYC